MTNLFAEAAIGSCPKTLCSGAVGPRSRALRQQRGATLASVSAATGISVSTLSRLESGDRKPTLELLLALSRAYQVPLDELVGVPPPGDSRVRARPVRRLAIWLAVTAAGGIVATLKTFSPSG